MDQRSLNSLKNPYMSLRTGRAVFIQYSTNIIFVAWLPGLDRESVPWDRKSHLRHPVELDRGTPLAFPMDPRNQILAPRIWEFVRLKARYESTRTFCQCASMHNGCSSPILRTLPRLVKKRENPVSAALIWDGLRWLADAH